MKKSVAYLAGVAALTLFAQSPAGAVSFTAAEFQQARDALTALNGFNLIALGNLTAGHDIEGKAYVGGNIGGNGFTAGLGSAATGQSAAANEFATLTVGGNISTGFNLNNGTNASNVYGLTVGGSTGGFTLNGNGAKVRIGGNVGADLSTASNTGAHGADISITGYVSSVTATAAGSIIKVGSVGTKIEAGNNATVQVASGNVQNVTVGTGSTVKVGGAITNQLSAGNGSTSTVTGGVSNASIGANSSFQSGGSVDTLSVGSNSSATISGNVGQNLNLSTNDTIRIGGQFQSQNVNGLPSGTTVAVSGANQSQNGAPAGWTFKTGVTYAAPAGPGVPAAPTGPDGIALGTITATLTSNLTTLSSVLGGLYSAAGNTAVLNGTSYTFTAGATAANAARGYAAFNVGTDIFGATNINFDFASASGLPIVINVNGLGAGTYNWAANANTGNTSAVNQKVIWNFVGASGTINFGTIVHGSVLAPNATVANATPIEGSVAVKNFIAGGEVHLGTFNGTSAFVMNGTPPPPAVPEPAIWAQMILGFGIAGIALRRRRAGAVAA